jgi:hypothetical protein
MYYCARHRVKTTSWGCQKPWERSCFCQTKTGTGQLHATKLRLWVSDLEVRNGGKELWSAMECFQDESSDKVHEFGRTFLWYAVFFLEWSLPSWQISSQGTVSNNANVISWKQGCMTS